MKLSDLSREDIERIRNDKTIRWITLAEELGLPKRDIQISTSLFDRLLYYDFELPIIINALYSQPNTESLRRYLQFLESRTWQTFPLRELEEYHQIALSAMFKKRERALLKRNILAIDLYNLLISHGHSELAEKSKQYIIDNVLPRYISESNENEEKYLLLNDKIQFVIGPREKIESALKSTNYVLINVADIPTIMQIDETSF